MRFRSTTRNSRWIDKYGNSFRYVAGINDTSDDPRCYDVFLVARRHSVPAIGMVQLSVQ